MNRKTFHIQQFQLLWDLGVLSAQHKHLETWEEDLMENVDLWNHLGLKEKQRKIIFKMTWKY